MRYDMPTTFSHICSCSRLASKIPASHPSNLLTFMTSTCDCWLRLSLPITLADAWRAFVSRRKEAGLERIDGGSGEIIELFVGDARHECLEINH